MKIAYVTADFGVPLMGTKGASVHVRRMVGALSDRGHEVLVLTPNCGEGTTDELACEVAEIPLAGALPIVYDQLKREKHLGSKRVSKDLRNILYSLWLEAQAAPLLEGFGPDVVYERYSLFGTAGLQLAGRFGAPLILEVNAPLVEEQRTQRGLGLPRVAECTERLVFSDADELIVVSDWLREYAVGRGAGADRITVLPNAADPDLFHPGRDRRRLRRELQWEDRFVVGFVGAMKSWHGLPTLLEALERLGSDFRLLLVGDGPELPAFCAQMDRMGLAECVHTTGPVPHETVPQWLAAMDVALVPYAASADVYFSPVKLFEYMSSGLPVVAARIGQTEEVIEHGRTGWLYAAGESDELAERIRWLSENRTAAEAAGAAAREQVLARHTWRHNAMCVERIAGRAIDRRRAAVQAGRVGAEHAPPAPF